MKKRHPVGSPRFDFQTVNVVSYRKEVKTWLTKY
nr:MAG TPA: protein of unknown function (DUF951) [Caudoviricetes sp.]